MAYVHTPATIIQIALTCWPSPRTPAIMAKPNAPATATTAQTSHPTGPLSARRSLRAGRSSPSRRTSSSARCSRVGRTSCSTVLCRIAAPEPPLRCAPHLRQQSMCQSPTWFSPAHELFGSRKLRLAPQDYSPWTPPTDRLSGRSYPPASRHPRVLDLVGSALGESGADRRAPATPPP